VQKLWEGDAIQYDAIASRLKGNKGEQELIPFLGAGVSVSERRDTDQSAAPTYPNPGSVEKFASELGITGPARFYLEYAIRMAVHMQAWVAANGQLPDKDALIDRLKASEYPPAAWELAEMFSLLTRYHSFMDKAVAAINHRELLDVESRAVLGDGVLPMLKLAAIATDLASPTDPLASISGYYEVRGLRADLWRLLHEIISAKMKPTGTHLLIADIANEQLRQPHPNDYLIITTNYDTLIEQALDQQAVPYAVLWRDREGFVHTECPTLPAGEREALRDRNPKRLAKDCVVNKPRPMAIVYKLHGCLHPDRRENDDGLIISENDYVQFISDLRDIIPAHVGNLLGAKRLLLLGYSFSDWNVRSLYERIKKRADAGRAGDYAVTRSLSTFEQSYFAQQDIIVVKTDLTTFANGIRRSL
jgi:hypothetical protein